MSNKRAPLAVCVRCVQDYNYAMLRVQGTICALRATLAANGPPADLCHGCEAFLSFAMFETSGTHTHTFVSKNPTDPLFMKKRHPVESYKLVAPHCTGHNSGLLHECWGCGLFL